MLKRFCFFILNLVIIGSCVNHDLYPDPVEPIDCSTITWQNHILPIMIESCATSSCHDGISRLDWRDYNLVKRYATDVKNKTQDRSMPFDSTLPQEQIDMIACWVDSGAPNN
jgi:hypothetical protein